MAVDIPTDQRTPYDKEPVHIATQRATNHHLWQHQALNVWDRNRILGLFRGGIAKSLGLGDQAIEHAMAPMPASTTVVNQQAINWPLASVLSAALLGGGILGYSFLNRPDSQPTPITTTVSLPQTGGSQTAPGATGTPPVSPGASTGPVPQTPSGTVPKPQQPQSWDFRFSWWIEDGKLKHKTDKLPSHPGKPEDEPPGAVHGGKTFPGPLPAPSDGASEKSSRSSQAALSTSTPQRTTQPSIAQPSTEEVLSGLPRSTYISPQLQAEQESRAHLDYAPRWVPTP